MAVGSGETLTVVVDTYGIPTTSIECRFAGLGEGITGPRLCTLKGLELKMSLKNISQGILVTKQNDNIILY